MRSLEFSTSLDGRCAGNRLESSRDVGLFSRKLGWSGLARRHSGRPEHSRTLARSAAMVSGVVKLRPELYFSSLDAAKARPPLAALRTRPGPRNSSPHPSCGASASRMMDPLVGNGLALEDCAPWRRSPPLLPGMLVCPSSGFPAAAVLARCAQRRLTCWGWLPKSRRHLPMGREYLVWGGLLPVARGVRGDLGGLRSAGSPTFPDAL